MKKAALLTILLLTSCAPTGEVSSSSEVTESVPDVAASKVISTLSADPLYIKGESRLTYRLSSDGSLMSETDAETEIVISKNYVHILETTSEAVIENNYHRSADGNLAYIKEFEDGTWVIDYEEKDENGNPIPYDDVFGHPFIDLDAEDLNINGNDVSLHDYRDGFSLYVEAIFSLGLEDPRTSSIEFDFTDETVIGTFVSGCDDVLYTLDDGTEVIIDIHYEHTFSFVSEGDIDWSFAIGTI